MRFDLDHSTITIDGFVATSAWGDHHLDQAVFTEHERVGENIMIAAVEQVGKFFGAVDLFVFMQSKQNAECDISHRNVSPVRGSVKNSGAFILPNNGRMSLSGLWMMMF